jgi:hypothetical protein
MGNMKDIYTELMLINEALDAFAVMGAKRSNTLELMNGVYNSNWELCSRCELYAGLTYKEADQTLCVQCEVVVEGLAEAHLEA